MEKWFWRNRPENRPKAEEEEEHSKVQEVSMLSRKRQTYKFEEVLPGGIHRVRVYEERRLIRYYTVIENQREEEENSAEETKNYSGRKLENLRNRMKKMKSRMSKIFFPRRGEYSFV